MNGMLLATAALCIFTLGIGVGMAYQEIRARKVRSAQRRVQRARHKGAGA